MYDVMQFYPSTGALDPASGVSIVGPGIDVIQPLEIDPDTTSPEDETVYNSDTVSYLSPRLFSYSDDECHRRHSVRREIYAETNPDGSLVYDEDNRIVPRLTENGFWGLQLFESGSFGSKPNPFTTGPTIP
jgi:hypothetical protein